MLMLNYGMFTNFLFCRFLNENEIIPVRKAENWSEQNSLLRGASTFYLCFGNSVQYCTVPSSTYSVMPLSFIITGLYRQTFI